MESPVGFEPTLELLQSFVFPLHYGDIYALTTISQLPTPETGKLCKNFCAGLSLHPYTLNIRDSSRLSRDSDHVSLAIAAYSLCNNAVLSPFKRYSWHNASSSLLGPANVGRGSTATPTRDTASLPGGY